MFQIDNLNARWDRLLEWRRSEEYRVLCHSQQDECQRIIEIGNSLFPTISCNAHPIARTEYAVEGDIHRGYYCPSPIIEIIVGNLKRGRILKRVTAASKISHQFNFNEENHLQSCIAYSNGLKTHEEFLFPLEEKRYGITVNDSNEITAICEEVFLDNKIRQYTYAELFPNAEKNRCFHLHKETFRYDEVGLSSCKWEDFEPLSSIYSMQHIDFERENGYLSAYYVIERKNFQTEFRNCIRYEISKKIMA